MASRELQCPDSALTCACIWTTRSRATDSVLAARPERTDGLGLPRGFAERGAGEGPSAEAGSSGESRKGPDQRGGDAIGLLAVTCGVELMREDGEGEHSGGGGFSAEPGDGGSCGEPAIASLGPGVETPCRIGEAPQGVTIATGASSATVSRRASAAGRPPAILRELARAAA